MFIFFVSVMFSFFLSFFLIFVIFRFEQVVRCCFIHVDTKRQVSSHERMGRVMQNEL